MISKKIGLNILGTILGIILFSIGGIGMKVGWFVDFKALPGILIGVGCGVFGYHFGTIIQVIVMKKNPKEARRVEIEQKDERNLWIMNTAKRKAFDAMVYIYATVMFICVLLNVSLTVILLLVGSYLLVYGIMIYHFYTLSKEV